MKKIMAAAVAASLAGASGQSFAITDNEANASVPFSFSNPGARAMGMGGAFLGLADDASAAYANPAGLTQLVAPEVSAEVRSVRNNTRWLDGGAAPVDESGTGPIDPDLLRYSSQNDTTTSLRSFSYVHPWERFTLAVYRYELVDYKTSFESAGTQVTANGEFCQLVQPFDARADIGVTALGAALGIKASDRVSFGVGVNYYSLDIDNTTDRFSVVDACSDTAGLVSTERNRSGGGKVGVTLGARFAATDWLSIGLSYRQAPDLRYQASLENSTGLNSLRTGLNVPDIFGIGFSIRPSEAWVVNFDVNRVRYSELTDGLTSVFAGSSVDYSANELDPLRLDDGTEVRIGAEYTFPTTNPFSLRAGAWRDPEHDLLFGGEPRIESANSQTFSAGRGSLTHYTLGAGVVFKAFQLDIGADFADSADAVSLSGVYRF